MKSWIKALLWLGLGTGLGFFIGQQVGFKQGYERCEEQVDTNEKPEPIDISKYRDTGYAYDKAKDALTDYRGDYDGDKNLYSDKEIREMIMRGDHVIYSPTTQVEDDPDMPTEEDIAIDPDIPQLHPTHMEPEIIGPEEFNANIWRYDIRPLIFYSGDEVLYDESNEEVITEPENLIGIGTLHGFGGDPNNPVETLYVKSDTWGTLFRIDRVEGIFADEVDGIVHPEDDEPEDDDDPEEFTRRDAWDEN